MMNLLEIKNLHASIGDSKILHGINLTINRGEVHAIPHELLSCLLPDMLLVIGPRYLRSIGHGSTG